MLGQLLGVMEALTPPQLIAVLIIPVLFAIIVHEVAHGWVAKLLGDPTAERLGRLTLNPIKHIDPLGTILVPIVAYVFTGFIFGWAKPVPITWQNLRHPKRDMAIVAAAGPGANLVMALLWGLIVKIGALLPASAAWFSRPLMLMGVGGLYVNVLLMVFNLLPLPPLDGGRVAVGLLPGPWAWRLSRVEPYGFIILLALMYLGVLGLVAGPVISFFTNLISWFTGLG